MMPDKVDQVLGLDVGGVLVDRAFHDSDTSFFGSRPMDTPGVKGFLEGVQRLAELFHERIFIVSKAGPRVEELTRRWLSERGVSLVIPDERVIFVRHRSEKAEHCSIHGMSFFIDDRLDVLSSLPDTVRYKIWFTGGSGTQPDVRPGRRVTQCRSWDATVRFVETEFRRNFRS